MRLNVITLLLACSLGLHAQGDFAICKDSGPELLRQGAASSPQTQFCIAYLYAFGRGVPKDLSAAASHFRAAAEKGYTPAQAALGVQYARGLGVAQNWTEAVSWFRKAMIGGDAVATVNLGLCYQNGNGVPQDRQEAARLYRLAAAHGNAQAAGLLAKLGGAPPQAASGGSRVQAAAPANVPPNGQAQSNSNDCTSGPNAYTINSPCVHVYDATPQAALQITRENQTCRLLSQTQVYCMQPLVKNYGQKEGKFRPSSPPPGSSAPVQATYPIPSTPPPRGVAPAQQAEANQLWQRAAVLLNRDDPRDAMPLLYRCALMGDQRAEATLGIRYQDGDGVKADDHAAAYWFGLAAAQGHRASQYALAGMYLEGEGGLPIDLVKATDLFIKSANQGYDKAQLALGISYEFGEGVPRDRGRAIALIQQSGLANEIASVLANPRTPKSFANEAAFGAYLTSLRNAQIAAAWAQSRASRGALNGVTWQSDPYFNHNSDYWKNRNLGH